MLAPERRSGTGFDRRHNAKPVTDRRSTRSPISSAPVISGLTRIAPALGILLCLFGFAAPLAAQPGALDPAFYRSSSFNGVVYAVAVQTDGKVVVGGNFTTVSGVPRAGVARLNSNGSLDATFDPGMGVTANGGAVFALAIHTNGANLGKIVIGGLFGQVNGVARTNIARLNSNGTLDITFATGTGAEDGEVDTLAIQPADGKVVMGGTFTFVQGVEYDFVARLNANGTADITFTAYTDNEVYAVLVQPDGKILLGGLFTAVNGLARNGLARVTTTGALDSTLQFNPGTGVAGAVYALGLQSDGRIILGGDFVSYRDTACTNITRITTNGTLDATFVTTLGADAPVWAVAPIPGGKVLLAGAFVTVNGTDRFGIAQLNSNGSLDLTFDPGGGANDTVNCLALQSAGQALLGGHFNTMDGWYRSGLARLGTNGSVDVTFNRDSGTDDAVFATAVQSDGKLLLGGVFTIASEAYRSGVARLNADGTLDTGFDPGTGVNNYVAGIATYPTGTNQGKILIGGDFSYFNGAVVTNLARLLTNGALDGSFQALVGGGSVEAVAVMTNGSAVIGGTFTSVSGAERQGIARLNADGSLDAGFNPAPGISGIGVFCLAVLTNNKVLIGGAFTNVSGVARAGIARLDTNGVVDLTFDPGVGVGAGTVNSLAVQRDGKILLGGTFTTVRSVARNGVARLNADGTLDATFDPGAGAGGAAIWSVATPTNGQVLVGGSFTNFNNVFQAGLARLNTNGVLDLGFDPGAGVQGDNGSVYALSLQTDGKVVVGGSFATYSGAECWNLTRVLSGTATNTAPRFLSAPLSYAALAGESVTLSAQVAGSRPLSYQWRRNGSPVPAATGSALAFNPITTNHAGSYVLIATNSYGAVTSAVAAVSVTPTIALSQALNNTNFVWATGGDRIFYGQTTTSYDGSGAAQNAPLSDNQQVWLATTVQGPGKLSFWWKVSSEPDYDFLEFAINGYVQMGISGEVGWTQLTYPIPAGPTTVTWSYSKDGSSASGQDAGWVDRVSYDQTPRFESPAAPGGGPFQFKCITQPGQVVVIQASTNLLNWATLTTLTNPSGAGLFIDSASPGFNRRFYRAFTP